mgnify:CR=1 FL=1
MKVAVLSTGVEPFRFVGEDNVPVADSVQSVGSAVPPLSVVNAFLKCKAGALSLLVIVQVLLSPAERVTFPFASQSPPIVEV